MNGWANQVKCLARSRIRTELLDILIQEDRLSHREIREQFDCSRTTISRNLDVLIDQGWVQSTNQAYSVTTCGKIVLDHFSELTEAIEATSKLQPFLQCLSQEDINFDVTMLRDAEITISKAHNPLAMVNKHVNQLRETTEFRAVLPLAALHPYEVQYRRIAQEQLEAEHVVSPGVAKTFQTATDFASFTRDMLDSGRFDIYVYEGDIPYYLGILDQTVQLGADKEGEPRVLLETDSKNVRTWAREQYQEYKQSAAPLSASAMSVNDDS